MADLSKEELSKEIADILKDADLKTTTSKKVRQQLENKLDCDLTARKKEIDDLVMEFLYEKEDKKEGESGSEDGEEEEEEEEYSEEEEKKKPAKRESAKKVAEEEDEDEENSEEEEKKKPAKREPAKKAAPKRKKASSEEDESASASEDDDDSDEYSPRKAPKKGKAGKKGKKAKKSADDSGSDAEWGKSAKKSGAKKKGGGGKGSGYTRQLTLSPALAAIVGANQMARYEVVKKLWAVIKEKNLFDPKNKQFAICDDDLFKVIGVKRFRTFAMMKYLKDHFVD